MKNRKFLIILLLLILLFTGCQPNDTNLHTAKNDSPANSVDVSNLSRIIEDSMTLLTSDGFQGRLTGSEGNDKAVDYLINTFQEIGLEPWEKNNYYNDYKQEVTNQDTAQHVLKITLMDGSTKEFIYGTDFTDLARLRTGEVSGPITFDPNDKDLGNKIVVVKTYEDLAKIRDKAKGILQVRDLFFGHTIVKDHGTPSFQITKDLYDELKNSDIEEVYLKGNYDTHAFKAKNVVGVIRSVYPKKALVLSAHIDHVGWAGDTIYPGAVDNASGTSVLLDLARRLKNYSKDHMLKMDIIFCGINGEEYFLLGSSAFADTIATSYEEVYNINIDCVGKKDGGPYVIGGVSHLNKDLKAEISEFYKKHHIDYSEEQYGASDHDSFISHGIPAVTIGQRDLRGHDVPNPIHTTKDTIEVIDFYDLHKISDMIFDFVTSNNGVMYGGINSSKTTQHSQKTDQAVWDKLITLYQRDKDTLAYDDYKVVEIDGNRCTYSGNRPLISTQEINKYYPTIEIQENVENYKFESISIFGEHAGLQVAQQRISDNERDKVFKRDLSLGKVTLMRSYYTFENEKLNISINKQYDLEQDSYLFDLYSMLETDINGELYYFMSERDTDALRGIYKQIQIENSYYGIQISKLSGTKKEDGSLSYKLDNTKEGLKELVQYMNLTDFVKDLDF